MRKRKEGSKQRTRKRKKKKDKKRQRSDQRRRRERRPCILGRSWPTLFAFTVIPTLFAFTVSIRGPILAITAGLHPTLLSLKNSITASTASFFHSRLTTEALGCFHPQTLPALFHSLLIR